MGGTMAGPGVVAAVVLAMGSLQRTDLQEFRAAVQSDVRMINGLP